MGARACLLIAIVPVAFTLIIARGITPEQTDVPWVEKLSFSLGWTQSGMLSYRSLTIQQRKQKALISLYANEIAFDVHLQY